MQVDGVSEQISVFSAKTLYPLARHDIGVELHDLDLLMKAFGKGVEVAGVVGNKLSLYNDFHFLLGHGAGLVKFEDTKQVGNPRARRPATSLSNG